jgi:DNA-binding MarR family transcriptional regulator
MNPLFFEHRRAYRDMQRAGRADFDAVSLTAARFELLYALTDGGRRRPGSTLQSALIKTLGVTRATISRTMRSLESLQLLTRQRSAHDGRQIEVELTDRGFASVRAACERLAGVTMPGGAPCDRPARPGETSMAQRGGDGLNVREEVRA